MTVMFYDSAEAEQSTSSQTWTQVASKTGNLLPTRNFLHLYAEYGGSATNRIVGIRVLVDGQERGIDSHTPELSAVTGGWKAYPYLDQIQPLTEGQHTISLEVRTVGTGQTVFVRRIRLMVFQV
jgi:hypothetical protein